MKDKSALFAAVEARRAQMFALADEIYDRPEPPHKEFFASGRVADTLAQLGYAVERGPGGLETAVRAKCETAPGGPSVGLLAEYDALPIGHACGHHMQAPILIAAAEAVREVLPDIPYTLVFYGTPAEEDLTGKNIMNERGLFRDIDVALMTHASPYTTVDIKSLASVVLRARFCGVMANEELAPELSRSALDALLLAMQGMEFLRGHTRRDNVLLTSVESGAGETLDPFRASGLFTVQTYQAHELPALEARVRDIIRGAALMSGVTAEVDVVRRNTGKLPSHTLNDAIMKNADLLGAPQRLAFRERTGGTDFACVTHLVPGAVSRFPIIGEQFTSHSPEFLAAGKTPFARDGMLLGAKIIAGVLFDLLTEPELLQRAKEEHARREAEFQALAALAR